MQSEESYQEADDLQEGWGDYLRKIDKLRERVEGKQPITLDEACWVLWAELHVYSTGWKKFRQEAEGLPDMPWEDWKAAFCSWRDKVPRWKEDCRVYYLQKYGEE